MLLRITTLPTDGWTEYATKEDSNSKIFTQLVIPLALIAPIVFLFFALQPGFHLPIWIGVFSCILVFGLNVAVAHIFAVIFEQLAIAMTGSCSRSQSLMLSISFLTPWFILFALFPFIGPAALLGLIWGSYVFSKGVAVLRIVSTEQQRKFCAVGILMAIVVLLMANFFFVGFMSVFAGAT